MSKKKKKKMPDKLQIWIDARKRYRLSHAQAQMARELGLNPGKFGGVGNNTTFWSKPIASKSFAKRSAGFTDVRHSNGTAKTSVDGYVDKWPDWPWSSATDFLERVGRETAEKIWREYPILDYGKKWDVDPQSEPEESASDVVETEERKTG